MENLVSNGKIGGVMLVFIEGFTETEIRYKTDEIKKFIKILRGGEKMDSPNEAVDPITTVPNIKALRVEIDAVKQKVKAMADRRPPKGGAELTLSFRALQQAKHWLGEALGELGEELPAQYADKA